MIPKKPSEESVLVRRVYWSAVLKAAEREGKMRTERVSFGFGPIWRSLVT